MNRSALFLLLMLLGTGPAAAAGPPPDPAAPDGLLSFAQVLLRSGESYRAATEYMRFLHHYPDHPDAAQALEGLGRAYAAAGRWEEAAAVFTRLQQQDPSPERNRLLGAALYRAKRYDEAARRLLVPAADEQAVTLGTLALLRAGSQDPWPTEARDDLRAEHAALPRKSPGTALGLSAVLPGAGHLYCDRPRDAAVALLLNAAFIWGTVEAVRHEEYALAGILGTFELGWYSGTLVSSANAAHKWNRRAEGAFFRQWEEWAVPRWEVALAPTGIRGTLAWSW